jgi:hypothetical protein
MRVVAVAEAAEAVQLVPVAEAVGAASGAVVAAAAFAVGAEQGARASAARESAAIGPHRFHRLVSASWMRVRSPRSLQSRQRSLRSAPSFCGIAVRPLRLPRSSPATADRLAPNRYQSATRLAMYASRVPYAQYWDVLGLARTGASMQIQERTLVFSWIRSSLRQSCHSNELQIRGISYPSRWGLPRDPSYLGMTPDSAPLE